MSQDSDHSREALRVLLRVIDLEDAEREQVLAEECADSPELRERVDSLLAHDFDNVSVGPSRRVAQAASQLGEAADEVLPKTIGPFEILDKLGHGGQGTVFRAHDPRLDRIVAVKVLRGAFLSEQARRRFRREAEVVAGLNHPDLCSVLEAEVDGEVPYIAMPFVAGWGLAEELGRAKSDAPPDPSTEQRLPLAPRTTVELHLVLQFFERIASALHVAHEAGIIHRDIKPANLIIAESGKPVVLDFGMARTHSELDASLTQSGDVFGTPPYMSPEQWAGQPDELDRRSDIFSLAVTLFECLTLERPFQGDTPYQLQYAILSAPTPDVRAVAAIARDGHKTKSKSNVLTRDVQVVLERALDKDPARRYASAAEFAEDLRRIREYEPIQARPAGTALRLQRWARRQPAVAGALVALFLSLTIGLILALYLIDELGEALDEATGLLAAQDALELTATDEQLALAQAIQGVELAANSTTRSALLQVLDECQLERIFRAPTGRRIYDMSLSPTQPVVALALGTSRDGINHGVRVVDYTTGELAHELASEEEILHSVCFSADGEQIVAGGASGRIELWQLGDDSPTPIFQHESGAGAITWIEFAPGGEQFVAQPAQGGTLLFNTTPPRFVQTLNVQAGSSGMARFSPDGTRVLVSSKRSNLPKHAPAFTSSPNAKMFDSQSGQLVAVLEGIDDKLQCTAFQPDGKTIATVSESGSLDLWDGQSGVHKRQLVSSAGPMEWVQASPAGDTFAYSGQNGPMHFVELFEPETGTRRSLQGHTGQIVHVAFDRTGERLLTSGRDKRVIAWDVSIPSQIAAFQADFRPRTSAWSPDGRHAITLGLDPKVFVWRTATEPGRFDLQAPGGLAFLAFDANHERLISAGSSGADRGDLRVWRTPLQPDATGTTPNAELLATLPGHNAAITAWRLDAAADGARAARLLTGSADGSVVLWELGDEVRQTFSTGSFAGISEVEFSPDPLGFLVVDDAGAVWTSAGAASQPVRHALPGDVIATGLHASPDRRQVAICGSAGWLGLLDVGSSALRELRASSESKDARPIHALAWHPTNNTFAFVTGDSKLQFHDASGAPAGAKFVASVRNHADAQVFPSPQDLRFDSTGKRLLILGREGGRVLSILNVFPGELLQSAPNVFSNPITRASFSANERHILVGERGGVVTVLDAATLEPHLRREHDSEIRALAVPTDPGLPFAASGSLDGQIRVWPLDPLPMAKTRAAALEPSQL